MSSWQEPRQGQTRGPETHEARSIGGNRNSRLPRSGLVQSQLWARVHNWQNGNNESFNGKFRDECLSMEWFRNRIDAKIVIEDFRRQYNEVRPHSSLGQLTPAEFKQKLSPTNTPEPTIS